MSGRLGIAFLMLGMMYLNPGPSFADPPVTADQALALGEELCAPLVSKAVTSVHWIVYPANAGSNKRVENGAYWLVDGQYYPQTPPGIFSVIDMVIFVPKSGMPPEPCSAISN
jgi:hypothetical protein